MKPFIQFKKELNEALIKKGGSLGSNPGGFHHDDETGEDYYVKFPRNPEQARVEALSSKLHQMMGINAIPSDYRNIEGKDAVISKWIPNLTPMKLNDVQRLSPESHHQIGKIFAAAILTRNHDAVGTGVDYGSGNIYLDKDRNVVHGDVGGSFHFRARGGLKPYESNIGEIRSMRDETMAPEAAHVFNTAFRATPTAERAGYEAVKNLNDQDVFDTFKNSGVPNWEDLHKTFMDRKQLFLNHHEGKQ